MIPRVVQMAAEVAAQFTTTELDDYGNIILNGYATTGPNTTGKLAWQYKETTTAPAPLPSVTSYQPALKGWTTNYQEYYTQLQPNGYGVNPGDPTMFEYRVHSFSPLLAPITSLAGFLNGGSGYTPGTYAAVATTTSGVGTGATVDVVVDVNGEVVSISLDAAGSDYAFGDAIYPSLPGTGASTQVAGIDLEAITAGSDPQWAQAPRRTYQNQVSSITLPQYLNNPEVIQYSFIHPVADSLVAPPVDVL
jgi:hypothetical protein